MEAVLEGTGTNGQRQVLDGEETAAVAAAAASGWRAWLTPLMTLVCCLAMAYALPRIDFHADEAIYLQGVPVNVSNDSGLVYHWAYLATSLGQPTPLSARWTSLLFGFVLVFSTTRVLQLLVPHRSQQLAVLVPLLMGVSYQGVFSILRVRPEISWFAMTGLVCWCLAELRVRDRWTFRGLLLFALLLLPMNHMLSLFACFFVGIYLACFARRELGTGFCGAAVGMMAVGLVLNRAIRSWMVIGQVQFLPELGGHAAGPRPSIQEFVWNVFWNSPSFLNDSAAISNIWNRWLPGESSALVSHCLVATMLVALALPLPLLMKSWESRYVASIPLLTLVLFYASGYFNPTYTPLLSIYAVAIFAFIFASRTKWNFSKACAGFVLLVTLLNGASFLSTRILNHGPATFFAVEASLREEVARLPAESSVAVAERFQSVVEGHRGTHYILFKDELPAEVDMLVLDNYDFDMYRFVPEYDSRRAAIEALLASYAYISEYDVPVYTHERLSDAAAENQSLAATQGSWFFRNSVKYRVSVLSPHATERVAERDPHVSTSEAVNR